MGWLDGWRNATVAIGEKAVTKTGQTVFQHLGTGALMYSPSNAIWLVTAKHVIDSPKLIEAQLRFAWHDAQPLTSGFGARIQLRDPKSGAALWVSHPNPNIDLACISLNYVAAGEVGITPDQSGKIALPTVVALNDFLSTSPFAGMQVLFLGYPGALDSVFLARAILRQGIVAWVDATNPATERLVIDGNVIHGNSGGPVFLPIFGVDEHGTLHAGRTPSFVGIVSQTRFQPLPIQSSAGALAIASTNFIGIGIVEPASRVRDLLQHAGP